MLHKHYEQKLLVYVTILFSLYLKWFCEKPLTVYFKLYLNDLNNPNTENIRHVICFTWFHYFFLTSGIFLSLEIFCYHTNHCIVQIKASRILPGPMLLITVIFHCMVNTYTTSQLAHSNFRIIKFFHQIQSIKCSLSFQLKIKSMRKTYFDSFDGKQGQCHLLYGVKQIWKRNKVETVKYQNATPSVPDQTVLSSTIST